MIKNLVTVQLQRLRVDVELLKYDISLISIYSIQKVSI